MRSDSIRVDFPHFEIGLEDLLTWCGDHLPDSLVEHHRHAYSGFVDDVVLIQFDPGNDHERVLFRLRWDI
jgi:hypothetical protein